MIKPSPNHIQKSFSNAASRYDQLAYLQQNIAKDLLAKVDDNNYQSILDIGTGTGQLAKSLKLQYPDSQVYGCDVAQGMLQFAAQENSNIEWLSCSAENVSLNDESQDLIVSASALHWVDDLQQAFSEVYRLLKPRAQAHIALFGQGTLRELFDALLKSSSIEVYRKLPSLSDIKEAIHANPFSHVELHSSTQQMQFKHVHDLLLWLKNIGANRLDKPRIRGKAWLEQTQEYYHRHYAQNFSIPATFEVIWIKLVK